MNVTVSEHFPLPAPLLHCKIQQSVGSAIPPALTHTAFDSEWASGILSSHKSENAAAYSDSRLTGVHTNSTAYPVKMPGHFSYSYKPHFPASRSPTLLHPYNVNDLPHYTDSTDSPSYWKSSETTCPCDPALLLQNSYFSFILPYDRRISFLHHPSKISCSLIIVNLGKHKIFLD